MKRLVVCVAAAVLAAWMSGSLFAANPSKGMEPNKAAMREKMMQTRESRMGAASRMHQERIAELKSIHALALEEKATKTAAAIEKLIAKEQSELDKAKAREMKMEERMKKMEAKPAPTTPAPTK
jgi:hypothetical protein